MENKRLGVSEFLCILNKFWKYIPAAIFFLILTVVPIITTAQATRTVTGKVSDPTGGSIPGVSIVIKGTTTGTVTDFDGKYNLNNVPTNATFNYSFVGIASQAVVSEERD